MKKFLLSMAAVCSLFSPSAQVVQNRCGTVDVIKHRDAENPGYQNRMNAAFDYAKQIAESRKDVRASNDTVYRIQCVFHVLYSTAAENIPDSVIYSQLEVLNEDYRRKNADTVKTRGIFSDVAADARIEFYLATTDPDGNPTTGITRTQGNPGFLGYNPFQDNAKSNSAGGKDPWPTDRYLNIWVCNILNGLGVLGYAFPPSNAPGWPQGSTTDSTKQGVVLHYPVVGRNFASPIDPTVTMGRSAVHEIGHYLGLRHIWGDGNCSQDDGIDDTPLSDAAHQQTCDTTDNSCTDSPVDFPDMIENFMDYSDDRCLNMFTEGQVAIMHAMLQTSRAGIATVVTETSIKEPDVYFTRTELFPNPTNSFVTLQVNTKQAQSYSYELLNTLGEKLSSETAFSNGYHQQIIELSSYPAGIYFVRLSAGTQTVMKKVVKK
ncbi:MAG: T9SS type A sorting domain-containing protein [Chitinophagales bacterium]|nr:T9SS type A sorting domain-containing protein [Chitinophagales bacterium]